MLPKVLLKFTVPEDDKTFRIVQTYEGTLLEVLENDALGNPTWNLEGPLTRCGEGFHGNFN